MKCTNCGFENEDKSVYCANCGKKLANKDEESECPYCGESVLKDSVYCEKCGRKIDIAMNFYQENIKKKKPYTSAHVLGIVSICIATIGFFIPFIGQIPAIVTGIIGIINGIKTFSPINKKRCIVGFILCTLALAIAIFFFVSWILTISNIDITFPNDGGDIY